MKKYEVYFNCDGAKKIIVKANYYQIEEGYAHFFVTIKDKDDEQVGTFANWSYIWEEKE